MILIPIICINVCCYEAVDITPELPSVHTIQVNMGKCFQLPITEGTYRTIRVNFHFMTHVPTGCYPVPKFKMKLN